MGSTGLQLDCFLGRRIDVIGGAALFSSSSAIEQLIEFEDIPENNTHQITNERLASSLDLHDGKFEKHRRPNDDNEAYEKDHWNALMSVVNCGVSSDEYQE